MNWLDVFLFGIIVLSALSSLGQNFVAEVLSLTAWFTAFVLALSVMSAAATLLQDIFITLNSRYLVAFMAAFVLIFSVLTVLNSLIMAALDDQPLTWPYRVLACVFGGLRGGLMAMVLVFIAQSSLLATLPLWHSARLIPPLHDGNQLLVQHLAAP